MGNREIEGADDDDDDDMRRTEINAPKGLRGREGEREREREGEGWSCLGRKIRPSELRQEEGREGGRESRFGFRRRLRERERGGGAKSS